MLHPISKKATLQFEFCRVLTNAIAPGVHDMLWDTSTLHFFERCRIYTLKRVCQVSLLCLLLSILIPGGFFPVLSPTVFSLCSGFSLTKSSSLPELRTTFCLCPLLLHPAALKEHWRALCGHANLDMAPASILKRTEGALISLSMFSHDAALPLLGANWCVNECCELDIGSEEGKEDFPGYLNSLWDWSSLKSIEL